MRMLADASVGDPLQAGLVTNSEIGIGSFSVTPLVLFFSSTETG